MMPNPWSAEFTMQGPLATSGLPSEADLIARATAKDEAAIRTIIRQNNRRLFRIARSMIGDDGDAEDVLQEAYLQAFSSLHTFRGEAKLSTWLTRIVVNAALQRLRRHVDLPDDIGAHLSAADSNVVPFPISTYDPTNPERSMAQREMAQLVAREIDKLPDEFRTVLVSRVLEDMSVEETAAALNLRPETVKTRLHRARRLLRSALIEHFEPMLDDVFPFDGNRCDRLTEAVVRRLAQLG